MNEQEIGIIYEEINKICILLNDNELKEKSEIILSYLIEYNISGRKYTIISGAIVYLANLILYYLLQRKDNKYHRKISQEKISEIVNCSMPGLRNNYREIVIYCESHAIDLNKI